MTPAGACHTMQGKSKNPNKEIAELKKGGTRTKTLSEHNNYVKTKSSSSEEKLANTTEINTPAPQKSHCKSLSSQNESSQSNLQLSVKPHCSCTKCNFWNESNDWNLQADYQTEKCQISSSFIHSLFKKNEMKTLNRVQSLDCKAMKKVGEKSQPKLLIHRYELILFSFTNG